VRERLFERVRQRGIGLGMVFIDGTTIGAQHKAAGAQKGEPVGESETIVKRLAALAAARAPRCA
jgi:hypothetical protein